MANTIHDLYQRNRHIFAFKGNRPGESLRTKINELALIGDSYLYLEIRTKLVLAGLNTSQISVCTSHFLSNVALTMQAQRLGLIPDCHVGSHAAGTLLEAVYGYWSMSARKRDSKALIYTPYQAAFKAHLDMLVEQSLQLHKPGSVFDAIYTPN